MSNEPIEKSTGSKSQTTTKLCNIVLSVVYLFFTCFLECERERTADAEFAAYGDPFAVRLDYVFYDGQAETRSSLFARTALVRAVETLEDALCVLLADSETVVFDLDEDLVYHVAELYDSCTALFAVVYRVDDEVYENLSYVVLVGNHDERRRQVKQPNVRQRHNQRTERVKNGHRQKFVIHQRKKRS